MKGLDLALSLLHVSGYSEVYEEYDSCEQTWVDTYGYEMNESSILTSMFEMFYDNPRNGKGGVSYTSLCGLC